MMKHAIAAAVALAVVSFGASAAAPANHGTVTFKGEVTDSPCSITADNVDQTIDFGQISKSMLVAGGTSVPQPLKIKLRNCDASVLKKVVATFSGPTDGTHTKELITNGGTGTIVQMTGYGADVVYGAALAPISIVDGDNTLVFTTSVKQGTGATVKEGAFDAVANFTLNYQ